LKAHPREGCLAHVLIGGMFPRHLLQGDPQALSKAAPSPYTLLTTPLYEHYWLM